MFSQASVILFTGGGGLTDTPTVQLGRHPPGQIPPLCSCANTPLPGQTPHPPPGQTQQRTVRILLECILTSNACSLLEHFAKSYVGAPCRSTPLVSRTLIHPCLLLSRIPPTSPNLSKITVLSCNHP